jgi:DNA-dependent RNA polymerase auxiliary subunit epsilon
LSLIFAYFDSSTLANKIKILLKTKKNKNLNEIFIFTSFPNYFHLSIWENNKKNLYLQYKKSWVENICRKIEKNKYYCMNVNLLSNVTIGYEKNIIHVFWSLWNFSAS